MAPPMLPGNASRGSGKLWTYSGHMPRLKSGADESLKIAASRARRDFRPTFPQFFCAFCAFLLLLLFSLRSLRSFAAILSLPYRNTIGIIKIARILATLITGLIAGPAVSL